MTHSIACLLLPATVGTRTCGIRVKRSIAWSFVSEPDHHKDRKTGAANQQLTAKSGPHECLCLVYTPL